MIQNLMSDWDIDKWLLLKSSQGEST